ncbi:hypothetical protein ABK905_06740 [Acerihabitans sp. KWT182]|uniref:Uncharacterized protein n=1 Tax=Acerihabitans sp. KWT182 TaxID=3157919 RepID=A0AAU7QF41_9GAMM
MKILTLRLKNLNALQGGVENRFYRRPLQRRQPLCHYRPHRRR